MVSNQLRNLSVYVLIRIFRFCRISDFNFSSEKKAEMDIEIFIIFLLLIHYEIFNHHRKTFV